MPTNLKERGANVNHILKNKYKNAKCSLDYKNPLELLVATMLSAQCTDERVNKVTVPLFEKYKTAKDYANAPLEELEQAIHSTGFYRNKARAIKNSCAEIVKKHGGKVPATMDELVTLAGVGRKTANVVLGNVYGEQAIVVDTHMGRVAQRLGLTKEKKPEKIEKDLMLVIPQNEWTAFSHRVILLGRGVCSARKPDCRQCPFNDFCPSAQHL
ncbi:Endonuclease III [hydrothermal vent metagenome]|uniref:Endonuclease III n=1 Tax=hydrothermal vent metagenome TaxID=652676 RepID=A0A3B1C0D5_9ZZZZ